jgi:hypothetical protein
MRTQTTISAAPEPFGGGALSMFPRQCRAELSNELLDADGLMIESLIDFAFTTLGVQTLDVRVTSAQGVHMLIIVQD